MWCDNCRLLWHTTRDQLEINYRAQWLFSFLMPNVFLSKLKFVWISDRATFWPLSSPIVFFTVWTFSGACGHLYFPELSFDFSPDCHSESYIFCLQNTDYFCYFSIFVKFILSCVPYTSWVTLDHCWLAELRPMRAAVYLTGSGRARKGDWDTEH